ncbi:MAG TPA: cytosine deaminase, partial [Bellilinea sp.]|nr:cytosine deaminase [Bellilinea sp.]
MALDLLIKNALTRNSQGKQVYIGIQDGKIKSIGDKNPGKAEKTIDAKGKLVTESFVNGHLHLCKVYTLARMDDAAINAYVDGGMGGAMTAIELAAQVKREYDESWIIKNVRKALDLAVKYGKTHIR